MFFVVYDGDTEKNFLRSGVVDKVVASGIQVVLLIHAPEGSNKHRYYKEHFRTEGVEVIAAPRAMTRWEEYWYHLSWNTLPTRSSYVKRHDLYLNHRKHLRYALEQIAWILGHARLWREFLRLFYYMLPDDYASELFEKYNPSLVFAPNMFSPMDCRLLRAARKRGVRTLTTAKSWDVPTTRGFTRVKADRALTFNEINREEMVRIGDYAPERVFAVGFPQFDFYTRNEHYMPRDVFLRSIGADPNKQLVLFAAPGDFKNPYSDQIIKALDEAIEAGRFIEPVQVLARFHPKYPSRGELLKDLRHTILERPGHYFEKDMEKGLDAPQSTMYQWTFTGDDLIHLANSLKHASVVINTESTITLDAAANGTPVILIGFDGDQKLDYWHSIIRNYGREHLRAVLETKGAPLTRDMDDVVREVNKYLRDPAADAEGRKRIKERILFGNDGHAAERIANHIIEMTEVS